MLAAVLGRSAEPDGVRFGSHGEFRLEYSSDGFGMRSHGVIEQLAGNGGTKIYPLPQSSLEAYIRLRPADVKMNPISATAGRYERQEVIGPHQVEGDKLWFGKRFYDGEGDRGVGAFGYFDARTRQYQLFSPPEVAAYEVSAILVERDVVWVALDHFGEDISTFPGGLVRWNKTSRRLQRYPLEFVVNGFSREGSTLRLVTHGGYALMRDGRIRRFRIETGAAGGTRTTPIDRFPPPPSQY